MKRRIPLSVTQMNPAAATKIFAKIDPPIWLLTSQYAQQSSGLILTFVNQASIATAHPRVVVGLAEQHFTTELVRKKGSFVLHLLTADQLDWVWRFGLSSGRKVDKLAGVGKTASATGNPKLSESLVWLDCRVTAKMPTGDRMVFLAEIVDAGLNPQFESPLTLTQMLALAPADKKAELKRQMQRDREIDAQAIERWQRQESRLK